MKLLVIEGEKITRFDGRKECEQIVMGSLEDLTVAQYRKWIEEFRVHGAPAIDPTPAELSFARIAHELEAHDFAPAFDRMKA